MSDIHYTFVQVNEFTPADGHWTSIGQIAEWSYDSKEKSFLLTAANNGVSVKIYILGPAAFQVRFNPLSSDYSTNYSYAVVNRNLGETKVQYQKTEFNGAPILEVVLDKITLKIGLNPYGIAVYRGSQVINQDPYGYNLVYIPGQEVTACFKSVIPGAGYYGFGEKGGATLDKNFSTMTFFNYDNFEYNGSNVAQGDFYPVIPPNNEPGPLNVSEPLYNSTPVLLEWNPSPPKTGYFGGSPYAYLIFHDNPGQSYYNLQSNDYTDNMHGRYYFGALYGEMSYYFMAGDDIAGALKQYITLTGSFSGNTGSTGLAMPPMYALGFQQGCYGYYDRGRLLAAAYGYRANKFPIDGLHIDVDFQDNYRTFTVSNLKFPKVGEMFEELHENGFKCSTNITGIITTNPKNDLGETKPYWGLESGYSQRVFVSNEFAPPLSDLESRAVKFAKAAWECTKDAKENPDKAEKCIANNPLLAKAYAKYAKEHPDLDKVEVLQQFAINAQYFIANENYGCNTGFNPYPSPNAPHDPSCNSPGHVPLGTWGHYPDIGYKSAKQWWGEQYQFLIDQGLDMIWQDMTCPAVVPSADSYAHYKTLPLNIMMTYLDGTKQPNAKFHNAFAINLVEATNAGLTKVKEQLPEGHYNKDKRNFIVTRGGYAGTHRHAAYWTGDSASSWDFLKININEVLNWGMSGQPFSGCDIGGFGSCGDTPGGTVLGAGVIQGGQPSPELLTRWMTMGAFLPWYRNHYNGYTKAFQEPYNYVHAYPENDLGYQVLNACRKYVRIRYQLLQLFYDKMYEWTQTGVPLCRALFLNDPNDANLYGSQKARLSDQFFVGRDLLVAPIVEENATQRPVYLPEGSDWYVYTNNVEPLGAPSKGGQAYQWYNVGLDLVPIYVRAGAIIPMRVLEEWVGQLEKNPITYSIYPGPDSEYVCYQDDGITTNAELKGEYRITKVTHKAISNDEQEVTLTVEYNKYQPPANFYFVSFLGRTMPSSVMVNGTTLSQINIGDDNKDDNKNANELMESKTNAYYYNYSLQTTFVKIIDDTSSMTLRVSF